VPENSEDAQELISCEGLPLSVCQDAIAKFSRFLEELKTNGIIGDYFLTAIPAGHKMEISLAIKNLGHIKDVEMQTGITN